MERLHVSITVCDRYTELIHCCLNFLGWLCHTCQNASQGCTCLARFDSGVCHQSDRRCNILCRISHRTSDRSHVFKRLAHHADVGVCVGGRLCQYIRKMSRILCRQAERSKCVCDNIRSRSQIFAGCCSKVHDTLDAVQHITGFPSSHCHVLHRFGGLGSAELRLCAHLLSFIRQGCQVFAGCAGNSLHFRHSGFEIHADVQDSSRSILRLGDHFCQHISGKNRQRIFSDFTKLRKSRLCRSINVFDAFFYPAAIQLCANLYSSIISHLFHLTFQ